MSLDKWVEYGWLKRDPSSPDEIKGLLGIVRRSLEYRNRQRSEEQNPNPRAVRVPKKH